MAHEIGSFIQTWSAFYLIFYLKLFATNTVIRAGDANKHIFNVYVFFNLYIQIYIIRILGEMTSSLF